MHLVTGWRITPAGKEVGVSGCGSTFVLVASHPAEATAREDYQAEKQELDVDPKHVDKPLQETVKEM